MVEAAVKGSEAMAEDFTSWRKPLVRTFFYFSTFIFILPALPFAIAFKLLRKKLIDPYEKMHTELVTRWRTESSETALFALRKIHMTILENLDDVMTRGLAIESYGKFRFHEYIKVSHLRYHWELQHRNWEEADIVCDDILRHYQEFDPKQSKPYAEWIVSKARVIHNLDGNVSAQQYLLKYVDPEQPENPINKYLYELRNAPSAGREV